MVLQMIRQKIKNQAITGDTADAILWSISDKLNEVRTESKKVTAYKRRNYGNTKWEPP